MRTSYLRDAVPWKCGRARVITSTKLLIAGSSPEGKTSEEEQRDVQPSAGAGLVGSHLFSGLFPVTLLEWLPHS